MSRIICSARMPMLLLILLLVMPGEANTLQISYPSPDEAYIGDFKASKRPDGTILIKWSTISEHDNDFFSIEYSSDGLNYRPIGKINSQGNTANGFSYQFIHSQPKTGRNYYQLRMVEIAGKSKFSDIKMVICSKEDYSLSFFPNPANSKVYLRLDVVDGEELKIEMFDASGKKALAKTGFIKNQKTEIDIKDLPAGIYAVVVTTSAGEQFMNKLIITK